MHSRADPLGVLREEVATLDADLPVYGNRSMREIVATSPGVPARELLTTLAAVLAGLAMVLSAVGLFGLVAHVVAGLAPARHAARTDPLLALRGD